MNTSEPVRRAGRYEPAGVATAGSAMPSSSSLLLGVVTMLLRALEPGDELLAAGAGVTVTSSQPSRPKLLRMAWVLWISTGAVRYSHVVPGVAGELMADNCSRRLIQPPSRCS